MESPGALPSRGLVSQLVCRFHRYWAYSSKSTVRPKMESVLFLLHSYSTKESKEKTQNWKISLLCLPTSYTNSLITMIQDHQNHMHCISCMKVNIVKLRISKSCLIPRNLIPMYLTAGGNPLHLPLAFSISLSSSC